MTQRTVLQYIYDTQREIQGQANVLEVQQAIQDALKKINGKAAWEFLLATRNLMFQASYKTGTIAGTYGSAVVTGTGTVFDTTQPGGYWSFQPGVRKMPYMVKSFDSPTQLTLADPIGTPQTITPTFTGASFQLWRDRFPLPADCDPGRDLTLKGPFGMGADGSGDVRKKVRVTHERRRNEFRLAGPPVWYTDDGIDEALNVPTIRVYPPPTMEMEVRLLYYRRLTMPLSQAAVLPIPEDFESLIITMAAAIIMNRKGMKGWMAKSQEAAGIMNEMYSLYAASPAYSDEIEADDGGASSNREPIGLGGDLYTF